ncbi:MAG: hypothetical protein DRH24_09015 [Deltaproteobacteria bacterium]|nr:MAG: hypothetical protein DRH24_09015 [Deltaproteobacteria bacterium]
MISTTKSLIKKIEDYFGMTLLTDFSYLIRGWEVFVAGMEGTGSTFVYQIVRGIGVKPKKIHHYVQSSLPKVVTYRDPRDVICSYARRQLNHITDAEGLEYALLQSYNELFRKKKRHEDLYRYREDPNALLIKYEEYFLGNERDLISKLGDYFYISLDDQLINLLIDEYSLEKNISRSKDLNFDEIDEDSLIHGKHISNKGRIGGWEDILPNSLIILIKKELNDFLVDFGYVENSNW